MKKKQQLTHYLNGGQIIHGKMDCHKKSLMKGITKWAEYNGVNQPDLDASQKGSW